MECAMNSPPIIEHQNITPLPAHPVRVASASIHITFATFVWPIDIRTEFFDKNERLKKTIFVYSVQQFFLFSSWMLW